MHLDTSRKIGLLNMHNLPIDMINFRKILLNNLTKKMTNFY